MLLPLILPNLRSLADSMSTAMYPLVDIVSLSTLLNSILFVLVNNTPVVTCMSTVRAIPLTFSLNVSSSSVSLPSVNPRFDRNSGTPGTPPQLVRTWVSPYSLWSLSHKWREVWSRSVALPQSHSQVGKLLKDGLLHEASRRFPH